MQILRSKAAVPRSAVVRKERTRHLGDDRKAVLKREQRHAVAAELILAVATDRILTAETELIVLGDRPVAEPVLTARHEYLCVPDFEVLGIADRVFLEIEVSAKTCELRRERRARARRRLVHIVARIRHVLERNAARRAEILADPRCVQAAVACQPILRVTDILILPILQRDEIRRVLAHRTAQCELTARVLAHERLHMVAVGIVVVVFIGAVVETHRPRRFLLVEPRATIHKRIAACIRIVTAHLVGETDGVAHPAEIRVADAHHADHAVGARVARADAERARALLLDIDLHDDRIWLHTRIHLDVDILEEAEVVDALHTAARLIGVERLAGLLAHLAEDDALLGLLIALDLIALQRPLADADRERPILRDVEIRDLGEDIAVRAVLLLNRLHILLQGAPVEQLPLLHGHEIHEILRLFDRVALDVHFLQHGVLQHVIGQHDALGHIFKDRVEIVEVPRRVDCVTILDEHILRQSISDVHGNRLMRRLLRHLGGSCKVDLDDRLAHLCRKPLRHSILTGARARPRSRTCLCRARRRLVRQGRALLHRSFFRRGVRRIA